MTNGISSKMASKFIDVWLAAARDDQASLVEFLSKPTDDYFTEYRNQLSKLATAATLSESGLVIRYGHHVVDFYQQQPGGTDHQYLFHGTDSTWPILDDWRLLQMPAVNGTGIYFGQDFGTSEYYARRTNGGGVRSIFVFRKTEMNIISRSHGSLTHEYYLKDVPEYKLDSLEAIVFWSKEDVMEFDRLFRTEWSDERRVDFMGRKIKLYDRSLRPLDYEPVMNEFRRILGNVLDEDIELAFWPVGRPTFHADHELLMYLRDQTWDPQLKKKLAKAAIWVKDYEFIYRQIKTTTNEDEWLDMLMEGGVKGTLLASILSHAPADTRRRLLLMWSPEANQRLREWAERAKKVSAYYSNVMEDILNPVTI
jgi:hypothetical protein